MKSSLCSAKAIAAFSRSCARFLVAAAAVFATAAQAQSAYQFSSASAIGVPQTATVTVNIQTAGVANDVRVVTQGLAGHDFSLLAGGTCQSGQTYLLGGSCTVVVQFQPQVPGVRPGAVVVASATGALGTTFLSGTGQGPLEVLVPGQIKDFAGSGFHWNYDGDNRPATGAGVFLPMGGQIDAGGNVYFADQDNNRIRRVDASSGYIFTAAGNGISGFSGDGGLATNASLSIPSAVVIDGAGNLYIADAGNHVIRRVDAITGQISTIAGQAGNPGYFGDLGQATASQLNSPEALALDISGNLYIADTSNNAVRKITISTGVITTIAGSGTGAAGYSGDNVPAVGSFLNNPWGIAFGGDGSLYIADQYNNRIRKVSSGIITTVVGDGTNHFGGDGGLATAAELSGPAAVAVDAAGNLYVADSGSNRVRKVNAVTGIIKTIVGTDSTAGDGNLGPADKASLYGPYALFLDGAGNLFISDMFHNRIREVQSNLDHFKFDTIRQGRTSAPVPQLVENDGNATMTIQQITLVSNMALDPATTDCANGKTLATATPCSLGVEFLPTVVGDPVTGSMTVSTDAFNSPATITVEGKVLSTDPTTTTLTSSANPAAFGAAIVFTANVQTAGTVTPTGTVNFLDGSTVIGNGTLDASGRANFTTSSLSLGSHNITAVYLGDDNNFTSTSAVLVQVVKQATTTVLQLQAGSNNPSTATQAVTFTATVTAPAGTPTGSVVFKDGTTTVGNGLLNGGGVATFTTTSLSVGTHTITAVYSGDNNNQTSTSAPLSQTVEAATTTTTLGASVNNVVYGTSVTLTAQVTNSISVVPTGSVKFFDGATLLQSVAVDGTGKAVLTTSSLEVGNHNLTAVYQGDSINATSTSTVVPETINQISTTTNLTTSAATSPGGAQVTLTATITPSASTGGTITGTVTFKEGSTVLGTGTVNGSGIATTDISTLSVGPPHSIIAVYSGDTHFETSTSGPLSETIVLATTNTALTPSLNPITARNPVTFTATVTGNGGTPTGTVTFKDGAATLGSGTLNGSGVATYVANGLLVGAHSITAVYNGDAYAGGSTSTTLTETVNKGISTATLVTSANPTVAGKSLTLTATITTTGTVIPTGSVNFFDGANPLGTASLNAQGVAVLATTTLTVGSHSLTAVYAGDGDNANSTSAPVNETVQQAVTTTVLTSAPNPSTQGDSVTFTATVTGNGGTPTGTVQFLEGAVLLGSGTVNASGVATYSTSTLPNGDHSIKAVYGGDANDGGSTSTPVVQHVNLSTTVSLISSAPTAAAGATVIFTAAVSGQSGVPTGTITFKDGAVVIGTSPLDGAGRATLSISSLALGAHNVVANYSGDGSNAASASNTVVETIVQANTSTSLVSSTGTSTAGSPVTLTATVTGNGGTPGGQVKFMEGATQLGISTLNGGGVATLTVSSLGVGGHSVIAVYAGDTNDVTSTSSAVSITVNQAVTSTVVTSSANPSTAGVAVTLTAVVTGGANTPTGQVIWRDGTNIIGTTALDVSGRTTLTTSSLPVGARTITAAYSGDTGSVASTSPAFTQNVVAATSAVGLNSSANPSLYPDAVLFTATVTGVGTVPSGTVTFSDGATVLGTGTLNGAGVATFNATSLSIGAHSIVAAYAGDANHSVSQSAALSQNVLQRTSVALTSNSNPAIAETNVRLTATVTGQNGVVATGTVTFKEGAATIGVGTLDANGVAIFNTTTLSVGAHQIVAVYSGDSKNQESASSILTETINSATTKVALTSSANPSVAGAPLTFSAAVTGTGGAVTGTVTFQDGTLGIGTAPVDANGVASLTTSTLAPGSHTITATYSGDANNGASGSNALNQSILLTTAITLSSAQNPSLTLDPVVVTARISNGGAIIPTGTVTFKEGTTVLGTSPVDATGTATLSIPPLPAGQHAIVASYSGDGYNLPIISSPLNQVVQLRPTTVTVTGSATSISGGNQTTLIAVVHWTGPVTPTGVIRFTNGSTLMGTSNVDATGVGTLTVVLPSGTTNVVATYSGDAAYATSASPSTPIANNAPELFKMSVDTSTVSVQSKQFQVIHLTITSLQGFSDTMKLGCLGLPYAATCTFSKDSVALAANGIQTVTITVDTGSPLTAGGEAKASNEGGTSSKTALAFLLPGSLLLGLAGWRGRRRLSGLVLLGIMALGLTAGLTGCSSSLQVNGTPPGTYSFKLSASGDGSGITETMSMTLNVK